jgi:Flp pilus assembly protein TadG
MTRFKAWMGRGRDESGSALVEVAVTLSLFVMPVLLGTIDMGSVVYSSIQISDAAHAGAMYGMVSSTYAADTANIRTAAQADAPAFGSNLSVTPTVFYACSSSLTGTHYTTQSAAVAACTGTGNHALEFVQVLASASVTPGFRLPGLASTFPVSTTAVMEVEE